MALHSPDSPVMAKPQTARAWLASCLWLVALGAACGTPTPDVVLTDLDGHPHRPLAVAAGAVHVVVITSQECPIANSYGPTLGRLAREWADLPVRVFLAHVDPDFGAAEARTHRDDYKLPGTILMDPRHQLARALGATRTPEAVVLSEQGIAYRGRIDNQWAELGSRAPEATQHDLRDAVQMALRGEQVPEPHPQAVGCLLPEAAR